MAKITLTKKQTTKLDKYLQRPVVLTMGKYVPSGGLSSSQPVTWGLITEPEAQADFNSNQEES